MKPAAKVTIELDAKWVNIVRSPMWRAVSALQGIAVSFAPLALYYAGKPGYFPHGAEWVIVPACFAIIIVVSFFYFRLGAAVIRELHRIDHE
ncbi:MAG TPA: hypothetical protein VGK19_03090 [Capsulimonadaceae bacterium]|jgi:hypothetical protein